MTLTCPNKHRRAGVQNMYRDLNAEKEPHHARLSGKAVCFLFVSFSFQSRSIRASRDTWRTHASSPKAGSVWPML